MLIDKLISQDEGSYERTVNIAGDIIFDKVFYYINLRGFRIILIFFKVNHGNMLRGGRDAS